jgi:NAD(P)-dependent dehydrogenase (short-subunit alcohol dehydrogenase family)
MAVAVVTGGSRGLGLALSRSLVSDGWAILIDARNAAELEGAVTQLRVLGSDASVRGLAGDVTDPVHRRNLLRTARDMGGVDALVNNASTLGPSPRPRLSEYPVDALTRVYAVNVLAPLAIVQGALPELRARRGVVINITSDAGNEAYGEWGGYGSSKAALEHLTRVLAVEEPDVRCYAVDPGDLRTAMHQDAFPGDDISDRPLPDVAVPGLRRLLRADLPSGRYRAQDLHGADLASREQR